ncbi:hypothetical protein NM688_g7400 [Phlebia brevispora]|uniref:Uncharacterized protein n=1 Tax=Phlebia brevispora TaxID=194682 RepID=A0ACC1S644_9APHY|nr:hypothetical protein NM688_g7400 [Phlebia brevispora]
MSATSEKRIWFITGTSTGIGRALTESVLAAGEIVVAAARNPAALAELQSRYPDPKLVVCQVDVTNVDQITKAFETIKERFGRLDVVVNNAGYSMCGEIEGIPDDAARRLLEVDFWGPVNICKQAVKFFREVNPSGRGGRIVNLSSIAGYMANPCLAFYSAAKFALEGFTQSLNQEMAPEWNIKAIILEVGGVTETGVVDNLVRFPSPPAYSDPSSPTQVFQELAFGENRVWIGRKDRVAKAIIRIVGEPEPPLRLQLGSDSWLLVNMTAKQTLEDSKKWEDLSHSTNADGYDKQVVMKMFGMHARHDIIVDLRNDIQPKNQ